MTAASEPQTAPATRARTAIKQSRIEDYLLINGPYLPARDAARRLGVTKRTIERYRAELRRRRT